jgi:hypothetical protein
MAMPPCGTFSYSGIVPDLASDVARPWRLIDQSGAASKKTGSSLQDDRLVGLEPSLELVDEGITPGAAVSPHTGIVRPRVCLCRLVLRSADDGRATVAAFSFCIDRALARSWQPGDVLHLRRTPGAGLGLSVLRGERLIVAIGAVASVDCGALVKVRVPVEEMREAAQAIERLDPSFQFREYPLQVQIGDDSHVFYRGSRRVGDYDVFVEHGFHPGVPGTNECAAVILRGRCPETAAICSALLLEYGDLSEITPL